MGLGEGQNNNPEYLAAIQKYYEEREKAKLAEQAAFEAAQREFAWSYILNEEHKFLIELEAS